MIDAHWLWYSRGLAARVARGALLPAAAVFRAATVARDLVFRTGILSQSELGAPAVSIGNLTVGGTGKTPVAAFIAGECAARGARPAVLLRGYGGDETKVHALLTPSAIVGADADRQRGAGRAIASGANVLILDDAFQHRRVRRDVDIVLVSADAARGARWPIPAGPWREPLASLRRAQVVLVTRKAAPVAVAEALCDEIARVAPNAAVGRVAIAAGDLVRYAGSERASLDSRAGARALAVSAIGDPAAFEAQLSAAGMHVTGERRPDHYAYGPSDIVRIVKRAMAADLVVCTLKDAVKLGPLWPRDAPPLWYLSQHVVVEYGKEFIEALVSKLVAGRRDAPPA